MVINGEAQQSYAASAKGLTKKQQQQQQIQI
jgi:hypothetical protein